MLFDVLGRPLTSWTKCCWAAPLRSRLWYPAWGGPLGESSRDVGCVLVGMFHESCRLSPCPWWKNRNCQIMALSDLNSISERERLLISLQKMINGWFVLIPSPSPFIEPAGFEPIRDAPGQPHQWLPALSLDRYESPSRRLRVPVEGPHGFPTWKTETSGLSLLGESHAHTSEYTSMQYDYNMIQYWSILYGIVYVCRMYMYQAYHILVGIWMSWRVPATWSIMTKGFGLIQRWFSGNASISGGSMCLRLGSHRPVDPCHCALHWHSPYQLGETNIRYIFHTLRCLENAQFCSQLDDHYWTLPWFPALAQPRRPVLAQKAHQDVALLAHADEDQDTWRGFSCLDDLQVEELAAVVITTVDLGEAYVQSPEVSYIQSQSETPKSEVCPIAVPGAIDPPSEIGLWPWPAGWYPHWPPKNISKSRRGKNHVQCIYSHFEVYTQYTIYI